MSVLSFNFFQTSLDKGTIKRLLTSIWRVYGLTASIDTFDELKEIGFEYSTSVGFSMSLGDLIIPPQKKWIIQAIKVQEEFCDQQIELGLVTPIEQFQRLIDLWYLTSEALRTHIIENFFQKDTQNPVYTITQSGARGSIAQVRQLLGIRGLIANPKGEIVEYPIRANFREGLTLAEFAISGYGGRKGLVDTAVRTADAGYLTRRLVDVAHVVIVRQLDCGTKWNIPLRKLINAERDEILSVSKRAIGRVLASSIIPSNKIKELIYVPNQTIDRDFAKILENKNIQVLPIRSPLTCGIFSYLKKQLPNSQLQHICQLCYGWDFAEDRMVDLNQAVGIIAAQSIGEPGTQLTIRTFHTGGVFEGKIVKRIRSDETGVISFDIPVQGNIIRTKYGNQAFLTYSPTFLRIKKLNNSFDSVFPIPSRSILYHRPGEIIHKGQPLFEYNELPRRQYRGRVKITENKLFSDVAGQVWCPKSKPIRKVTKYGFSQLNFRRKKKPHRQPILSKKQQHILGINNPIYHDSLNSNLENFPIDWLDSFTININNFKTQHPLINHKINIILPQTLKSKYLSLIPFYLHTSKGRRSFPLRPVLPFVEKQLKIYKKLELEWPLDERVNYTYRMLFNWNKQNQLETNKSIPRLRAFKTILNDDQKEQQDYKGYLTNLFTEIENNNVIHKIIPKSGQLTGSLSFLESVSVLEGFIIKFIGIPIFQKIKASPNGFNWGFFVPKFQIYSLETFIFEKHYFNGIEQIPVNKNLNKLNFQRNTTFVLNNNVKSFNTNNFNSLESLYKISNLFACRTKITKELNLIKMSYLQWFNFRLSNKIFDKKITFLIQSTYLLIKLKFSFFNKTIYIKKNLTKIYSDLLLLKWVKQENQNLILLINFYFSNKVYFYIWTLFCKSQNISILFTTHKKHTSFFHNLNSKFVNKKLHIFNQCSSMELNYYEKDQMNRKDSIFIHTQNNFINSINLKNINLIVRPKQNLLILSGLNPGIANNQPTNKWYPKTLQPYKLRKTQAELRPSEFCFKRNLGLSTLKLKLYANDFNLFTNKQIKKVKKSSSFNFTNFNKDVNQNLQQNCFNSIFIKVGLNNLRLCLNQIYKIDLFKYNNISYLANRNFKKQTLKKVWYQALGSFKQNQFVLPSDLLLDSVLVNLKLNIKTYEFQITKSNIISLKKQDAVRKQLSKFFYQIKQLLKNLRLIFNSSSLLVYNNFLKKDYFNLLNQPFWKDGNLHFIEKLSKRKIQKQLQQKLLLSEIQKTGFSNISNNITLSTNFSENYLKYDEYELLHNYFFAKNLLNNRYPLAPLGSNFFQIQKIEVKGKSGVLTFKNGKGVILFQPTTHHKNNSEKSWNLVTHYPRLCFLPNTNFSYSIPTGITVPTSYPLILNNDPTEFESDEFINLINSYYKRSFLFKLKDSIGFQNSLSTKHLLSISKKYQTCCNLCWLTPSHNFSFKQPIINSNIRYLGSPIERDMIIYENKKFPLSGLVIQKSLLNFTVRSIAGYPVSRTRALFYLHHGTLINEGELVYTYSYQKQITGDIVQGIPIIESLFEGRIKRKGAYIVNNVRVPAREEGIWRGAAKGTGGGNTRLFESSISSLIGVRIGLVNKIQATYIQQGVEFSDKHVEIIVRRITSRVFFRTGGGTRHLPKERINEIVATSSAYFSSSTYSHKLKLCLAPSPKFLPSVPGLTKTALIAQSFFGSASFQESSKTFIRVGIKGCYNFLSGLKDQVITARTLFFNHSSPSFNNKHLFIVSTTLNWKNLRILKTNIPFILLPVIRLSQNSHFFLDSTLPINYNFTTHPLTWVLFVFQNKTLIITNRLPLCYPLYFRLPKIFDNKLTIAAALTFNQLQLRLSSSITLPLKRMYNNKKLTFSKHFRNTGSLTFLKGSGLLTFI